MSLSPSTPCTCTAKHTPRLVAVTGGPGAGKSAILELARRHFCRHVLVLPESASIVFGGGFPRRPSIAARKAAQRAILHVQRELELVSLEEDAAVVLCDRGTLDGLAYWPGDPEEALADVHTTLAGELARYSAVIHLRTPSANDGFNHRNPLRIESAPEAAEIDAAIARIWAQHPRRFFVEPSALFLDKARAALELIHAEVPACCRARTP